MRLGEVKVDVRTRRMWPLRLIVWLVVTFHLTRWPGLAMRLVGLGLGLLTVKVVRVA